MCDQLSMDALFILNIFYVHRNFTQHSGYHSKKLKNICRKKTGDFDKAIKELKNKGYITVINKSEIKYYISDRKKATFALKQAGYKVIEGKERKL